MKNVEFSKQPLCLRCPSEQLMDFHLSTYPWPIWPKLPQNLPTGGQQPWKGALGRPLACVLPIGNGATLEGSSQRDSWTPTFTGQLDYKEGRKRIKFQYHKLVLGK